ncbi:MAG: methyltransferase type 12 [uncultured bacterium (gcode 4)]|uniref:Methyltransferase type 12 n=1 Tax=uncultured bacterium (gcode 4) TaxID=1234023 RepID=K1YJ29_9BACT|nr:MAG: methyltransferase type 12 [uncultured bacterium (gcode 4)]
MIFKQIVLLLLLVAIMFFSLRIIYGLFAFMFKKDKSAMYVPSFDRHIRLMKTHLKLVRWKKLVDLWCGDGKAMRFFADTFGLQCDGYELKKFPYLYGKLINRILSYNKLHLYKKNFSQADLGRYDYIYVYLLPNQMAEIESWIFKHMHSHAIIISNSFQFAVHKPYEVIKDKHGKPSIFLYKK